ncbi:hypothetical protein JCM3775_006305 [Rhodotorula graminis]
MFHPTRGGTRGGQGDFKWTDVANDKDREFYLGHSLNAPVGRWQNGKDLTWYNKDKRGDVDEQERLRREELKKVKEAEEDALAEALGFAPTLRPPPSASTSTSAAGPSDPNQAILDKARRKAERHAEKEARRADRDRRREERAARHGSSGRDDRDRARSRSHDDHHRHHHRDHRDRDRERGERREHRERDRSRSPARRRHDEGGADGRRHGSRDPHDEGRRAHERDRGVRDEARSEGRREGTSGRRDERRGEGGVKRESSVSSPPRSRY